MHVWLHCGFSAATLRRKVEEAQIPSPGRDGRVALLATLKLLCGGGLEGATAAPLLLRRGGQSYSAPCCLGEASRFTSFPNLRLLRGRLWAPATISGGRRPCTFYTLDAWEQLGAFDLHRLHAAFHIRAAAAGGLTPTLHVGHLPVLEAIVGLPPSLRRNRDCTPQQRHHKGSSPRRRMGFIPLSRLLGVTGTAQPPWRRLLDTQRRARALASLAPSTLWTPGAHAV